MEETSTERTVVLDDQALFDLVTKKGEMVDKGRKLAGEMERLAQEHKAINDELDALTTDVNLVKIDIINRVKEVGEQHLGEYEIPVTTDIKDGKVIFVIADSMAEFTKAFKGFDKWKQAAPAKAKKED